MTDAILANSQPSATHRLDVFDALEPLLCAHAPALLSRPVGIPLNPALALGDDLGFDVIALAELAVDIEDELGVDIDPGDLFQCRTIRDLAGLIAAGHR